MAPARSCFHMSHRSTLSIPAAPIVVAGGVLYGRNCSILNTCWDKRHYASHSSLQRSSVLRAGQLVARSDQGYGVAVGRCGWVLRCAPSLVDGRKRTITHTECYSASHTDITLPKCEVRTPRAGIRLVGWPNSVQS